MKDRAHQHKAGKGHAKSGSSDTWVEGGAAALDLQNPAGFFGLGSVML